MKYEAAEILVSKEQIAERVKEIGAEISRKYRGRELTVVGILRGAVVFLTDLIRAIDPDVDVRLEFIKASSYGNSTESSGNVKLSQNSFLTVKGKNLLLVEDIIDTGRTLKRLKEYFRNEGAASVEVAALLDKKERRVVELNGDYIGFSIPDAFVVGYGLDYDEKMRALPDVHVMRPVEKA